MDTLSFDFASQMRLDIPVPRDEYFAPGVPGTVQFCIDPNQNVAYIFDFSIGCFVVIDPIKGTRIAELELKEESFNLIKEVTHWWPGSRFYEHNSLPFIVVLLSEIDSKKYFVVLFELNIEKKVAVPIEEHYIGVERNRDDDFPRLFKNENNDILFVTYWLDMEKQLTVFQVVKLKIDDSLHISHQILAFYQIINNFCTEVFCFKDCIYFFLFNTSMNQAVTMQFLDKEMTQQFHVLVADSESDNFKSANSASDNFYPPPNGIYSLPHCYKNTAYFYVFHKRIGVGEFWTLDLFAKKWHKCFILDRHVIDSKATVVVTPHGRLFLHGNCAEESCKGKAHLYHFGVSFHEKTIFPTIDQLGSLFSSTKINFIHGPKSSGKSFALLLKVIKAFQATSDSEKIKVFVANNTQRDYFIDNFSAPYNLKNIYLFSEVDMKDERFFNCEIFADGMSSFSFEEKKFFLNRNGKSTITFNDQMSFPCGLDQPRSDDVSWHRFAPLLHTEVDALNTSKEFNFSSGLDQSKSNNSLHKFQPNAHSMELLISQSINAMNELYPDWWSHSEEKETIFIPACHDVFNNRYLGPTDTNVRDFNQKLFEDKEHLYRGQKSENDLFTLFRSLQIGGIFISEFNAVDFVKTQKCHQKFKKSGISDLEIDAIFLHPQFGIYVFEVKATEQQFCLTSIKKAIKQLDKAKKQLPILFQNICNTACAVPFHFVLCFPNANIPDNQRTESFYYLDKISFRNETNLKSMIFNNKHYRPNDEQELISMKNFTAMVAGYRSLDFLSAGHNALAVHRLIDTQSFHVVENHQDGIFLTNEQLAVLQCCDQHQIISGPPGTGKTLLLLRKALVAAQTEKKGEVHVIAGRHELVFKFQKYFEKHSKSIVRFPIVHCVYKNIDCYLDNDDIFADEFDFSSLTLLQNRLKHNGQTVVVITGLFNPLEINRIISRLKEHNLTQYRHFFMNTVIRSSKEIFSVWKNDYLIYNSELLHLGHNINGPNVEKLRRKNSTEILKLILEKVRRLFNIDENREVEGKVLLGNLCIITDYTYFCSLIKSYLSCYRIPCGSIEEQIVNNKIVAVCTDAEAVSHEWPIVIVVTMTDIKSNEAFCLLASSRCIAKLIIIERDFLDIMEDIDQLIRPLLNGSQLKVTFSAFYLVLWNYARNNETESHVSGSDLIFQIIRWNIFFSELKQFKYFKACQSLSDCWKIITVQPTLCRAVLMEDEVLRRNLGIFKARMITIPNNPSTFFARITSGHMPAEVQEKMWDVFKRLMQALMETLQKENSGFQLTFAGMEEGRHTLQHLKRNGGAWEYVVKTITVLAR